jgi:hypothetical protein
MFIGHFAAAYAIIYLFPGVPPLIPLIGVSFPDLIWPFLILAGAEKVTINPETPLQKAIAFTHYPYSHSLLIGTLIACIPGAIIALLVSATAGGVFIIASASHWALDTIVHQKDLPVLGLKKDRLVGWGLWNYGRLAFVTEFVFYLVITVLVVPEAFILPLLMIGIIFHLINANSFFGFTKKNPFGSSRVYAITALTGFLVFILLANAVFSSGIPA